ncbi:MAG: hypothetical protein ACYC61_09235 [Isosphaeraceae bacterium]
MKIAGWLLLLSVALLLATFGHAAMSHTLLPQPDPTAEQAAHEAFHHPIGMTLFLATGGEVPRGDPRRGGRGCRVAGAAGAREGMNRDAKDWAVRAGGRFGSVRSGPVRFGVRLESLTYDGPDGSRLDLHFERSQVERFVGAAAGDRGDGDLALGAG